MSLSREEFLKRYMGAPEPVSDVVEKKKKKKKIKTKRSQGIIVVDNDLAIDNSFKDEVIDDKPKVQVINKQELIEKKLKGEIEDDQTWVDVGVVNIVRNTEDESSEEESSSVEEPVPKESIKVDKKRSRDEYSQDYPSNKKHKEHYSENNRSRKHFETLKKMESGIDDDADMEWGVGKVNREDKSFEKKLVEDDKKRGYKGRTINDELLNEMWKKRTHWEDPFAHIEESKERKKKKKAKEYIGHWPPNRFNIAPGYKWDGVDRSNGFEKRILQQIKDAKEPKKMEYIDSDDDI